jgi:signal transduction histidine kinase
MNTSPVSDNTRRDAHLIIHAHWITLARDMAILLGGMIVLPGIFLATFSVLMPAEATFAAPRILPSIIALWVLVVWMVGAIMWTEYYLDLLVITDTHLTAINQIHLFNREVRQWNIEAIQDIAVRTEGVFSSFMDYGTLWIKTVDEDEYDQVGAFTLTHPSALVNIILERSRASGGLESTNARQEELLHSISHEVKGHLARSAATFASIMEGDFGTVPDNLKTVAGSALADTRTGVEMVMNILDTSNFKKGTLTFAKERFDLLPLVRGMVEDMSSDAERKGLALQFNTEVSSCFIKGDEQKIMRHVVRNLIDNAIRYTQNGTIDVTLRKDGERALLSVGDTGVGMDADDLSRLFTEGGKGADSTLINPQSTGYGLFVAKTVVEAHGGEIWAQSDGKGMGSRFFVSIPTILQ